MAEVEAKTTLGLEDRVREARMRHKLALEALSDEFVKQRSLRSLGGLFARMTGSYESQVAANEAAIARYTALAEEGLKQVKQAEEELKAFTVDKAVEEQAAEAEEALLTMVAEGIRKEGGPRADKLIALEAELEQRKGAPETKLPAITRRLAAATEKLIEEVENARLPPQVRRSSRRNASERALEAAVRGGLSRRMEIVDRLAGDFDELAQGTPFTFELPQAADSLLRPHFEQGATWRTKLIELERARERLPAWLADLEALKALALALEPSEKRSAERIEAAEAARTALLEEAMTQGS